jgi:hypothetical protein
LQIFTRTPLSERRLDWRAATSSLTLSKRAIVLRSPSCFPKKTAMGERAGSVERWPSPHRAMLA